MKITIEYYRIYTWSMIALMLIYIGGFLLGTRLNEVLWLLIPGSLYSVLVALTNIRKGFIRAHWKQAGIDLEIPFQDAGRAGFLATDEEGNPYRIGPFRTRRES